MAVEVTEEAVKSALRGVVDPDLQRDIITLGFLKETRICGGAVAVTIELTTPACPVRDQMKQQAHDLIAALEGVEAVTIEMTARVRERPPDVADLMPGVRTVIAVASGKGGVGKSTVAANLAVQLAATGATVGLLDADIYGPSQPTMMGTRKRPLMQESPTGPKIVPIMAHGVLMMSLGFLLEDEKAVIWRGPMVASAIRQLLGDVLWGDRDYLIVDLPPGTGDAPLTLAQLAPVSGVAIVMTPQRVAIEIANKSVRMFRTLEKSLNRPIPILGIIENMSGGVFGEGGGAAAGEQLEVPFLGAIPLDAEISEASDSGEPIVLRRPDSAAAAAYRHVASALAARVSMVQFEAGEK
ncbi:MAG: Mrp/NBP35 family ATP-binding protein [Armatimonadetes bacterium]|nr:Mrp/NBP35 family ATP-binding protein [Armatimonadota bacterium]MDE2205142.1 Mrp/NBP35 family ATP-binding protein [Armatimonadota bacterium]